MRHNEQTTRTQTCAPEPGAPLLLLQPPGACRRFTRSGSLYPPLGLAQVAAMLTPERATVLDADGLGWTGEQTRQFIARSQARVLGLTATSFTLELVEQWAGVGKALGLSTMVGGPHASLEPYDLLRRCPSVDIVVRGEGERTLPGLLEAILAGDSLVIAGVVVRGQERGAITQQLPMVECFEGHPFPRLDQLPIDRYGCPDAQRRPMVTMMTTRGCPHRCAFCSSPTVMGRKLRGFPVPAVLDELERLTHMGVREISFVDDVFTLVPTRLLELCRGMIERRLDLSWFCNARADQIRPEMARAMKAAGCHQVYLGFESGAQSILDTIHKGTTVEKLEAGAMILKAAGIDRSIGFVLGLPGESDDTVAASIALARHIRPERIQFTRFTALPGTPLAAAGEQGPGGRGFHAQGPDQVGAWIARAYDVCGREGWGRESW